jgi:hypothetical protein
LIVLRTACFVLARRDCASIRRFACRLETGKNGISDPVMEFS